MKKMLLDRKCNFQFANFQKKKNDVFLKLNFRRQKTRIRHRTALIEGKLIKNVLPGKFIRAIIINYFLS